MKGRMVALGLVAAASFPSVPTALYAGDQYDDQVRRYLVSVREQVGSDWRLEASRFGRLNSGRFESKSFSLEQDVEYRFEGVCDVDCSDLDFRLFDENGNEVDSDLFPDDRPSVGVTPVRKATFRLRVSMAQCNDAPCAYGVAKFAYNP